MISFPFLSSPSNRCTCPQDQKCVRVSDDISISAFVYRCRTNDESNGLQVLPAEGGQEVTGSYVWSNLVEKRSLNIWLLSSLLTLTSSFSLTHILSLYKIASPLLRKLRFSSDPISFKCWKEETSGSWLLPPLLDRILLLLVYPFLFRSLFSTLSVSVPL